MVEDVTYTIYRFNANGEMRTQWRDCTRVTFSNNGLSFYTEHNQRVVLGVCPYMVTQDID